MNDQYGIHGYEICLGDEEMNKIKPIWITGDPRVLDRLEHEYRTYMGYQTRRDANNRLVILPKRNTAELGRP